MYCTDVVSYTDGECIVGCREHAGKSSRLSDVCYGGYDEYNGKREQKYTSHR